jgi:hypothetical protein
MHQLPNVDEIERYITERLLIAGSSEPNVFTPGAIDFIFQCSEGIPRQINNLCDNAMLAAYAAGEQIIGRQIIEEVADNLDLLPRNDSLLASDKPVEKIRSAGVLTEEAREELWKSQSRAEVAGNPKRFPVEAVNGTSNGKHSYTDDEISLEF